MKRSFVQLSLIVVSVLSYLPLATNATQVVYGLDQARHFTARIKNNVYIQVGNFKEKEKAYRQQQMLRSKTRYAVKIERKAQMYAVLIGPLHSAVAVRKTATSLVVSTKKPHRAWFKPFSPHAPVNVWVTKTQSSKPSQIPSSPSHPKVKPAIEANRGDRLAKYSTANWFVAAGAGAQRPVSMNNMLVNNGSDLASPYNQDEYAISHDGGGAVIALSAGRRWEHDSVWMPVYSVGLSWQYYFNTQMGSTIMQYSDPAFVNYNYNWTLKSNLLLATAKLNLVQYGKWSPYLNGGIGAAFNNASGYNETALAGVTPRISPGFTNSASVQFTYQVGAGIDFQMTPQLIVSLGYNYQNLGRFSSGAGAGTWSSQTLLSDAYGSNEVLVSVNYLFGQ